MVKRGYPNKEFRALVKYSNEARKNKRIKNKRKLIGGHIIFLKLKALKNQ